MGGERRGVHAGLRRCGREIGSYELEREANQEIDAIEQLIEKWKVGKREERTVQTGWRDAWTERWRARLEELKPES